MREKKRVYSERNNKGQWTLVSKKKPKPKRIQAARTCFINHLPTIITISDLAQIFRKHGAIENITIPTTQKNPNYKFAFVQYYYPQSLNTAIRDENGQRVEELKMIAISCKVQQTTNPTKSTKTFHTKSPPPNFKNPIKQNQKNSIAIQGTITLTKM